MQEQDDMDQEEMNQPIFDPEIGQEVMFVPQNGEEERKVVIVSKPENGSTKWKTTDGPINSCYLRLLTDEESAE